MEIKHYPFSTDEEYVIDNLHIYTKVIQSHPLVLKRLSNQNEQEVFLFLHHSNLRHHQYHFELPLLHDLVFINIEFQIKN